MNDATINARAPPHLLSDVATGFVLSKCDGDEAQHSTIEGLISVGIPKPIGGVPIARKNASCSSLVSAITIDEEAFSSLKPSSTGSGGSSNNAAFDFMPTQPVRGLSFSSPFEVVPKTVRRHSAEEALLSKAALIQNRFDMIANSPSFPPKAAIRTETMDTASREEGSEKRFLSKSLPSQSGRYISSSQHTGQIKSMFPLAKPMRKDVSRTTMNVVHRNNISTTSHITNCSTMHNASSWNFPPEERLSNRFLTASSSSLSHTLTRQKESLLPLSKPIRHISEKKDDDPKDRKILPKPVPNAHDADMMVESNVGKMILLQKSKSKLCDQKEHSNTTITSSTGCNNIAAFMDKSPTSPNYSSPSRRALRCGLRRSTKCMMASEEPLESEASIHKQSGHKRSNMKSCNSTSTITNSTSPENQSTKRLRRHSSPWNITSPHAHTYTSFAPKGTTTLATVAGSSTANMMFQPLPAPPLSKEVASLFAKRPVGTTVLLQMLPPGVEEAPLGKSLIECFSRCSTPLSSLDPSLSSPMDEDGGSFTATPKTLRRTGLLRFSSSHTKDDDRPMILPPKRQNSAVFNTDEDGVDQRGLAPPDLSGPVSPVPSGAGPSSGRG